ncbi:MAG: FHA domain-containing protein [Nitrospirae bacterium]|nr:FHA domain-containing protein [Nitrospirota bacterium]
MNSKDDKTVWLKPPVPVTVRVEDGSAVPRELRFTESFRIGRDKGCEVQIKNPAVSKSHLEVRFDGDRWHLRDLNSSNGTYLNGVRIQEAPLSAKVKLELGKGGPILWLTLEGIEERSDQAEILPGRSESSPSMTQVIQRYFAKSPSGNVGEHTMTIRRAFERVSRKQSRKYWTIIAVAAILLIGAGGVVVYQQIKLQNLKYMAADIFYTMKTLELQVAQIESVVLATANPSQRVEMASKRAQLQEMENRYAEFVDELGLYGKKMSEEDRIILRTARIFGECEVNMPAGFVREVRSYIEKWKSSDRLNEAIRRAETNGYAHPVTEEMLANHLPPQFFYLALKESGFDDRSVGPKTRYGIAKGVWQFIPPTAIKYGLRPGPLLEVRRYDPRDERYDFEKATRAAARYLKDIYSTEAQASGLLVIASYNWGENNVREMIHRMPENPRERNFWRLLERYKIPQETYDYVFYIFSAAVIGENPRLFGFDFNNPISNPRDE